MINPRFDKPKCDKWQKNIVIKVVHRIMKSNLNVILASVSRLKPLKFLKCSTWNSVGTFLRLAYDNVRDIYVQKICLKLKSRCSRGSFATII